MAIKMRGLFKGLTYLSHKSAQEPELQIGAPTDVKHVAHIGWDGPTANPPSWMSQYKSEGDLAGVEKVDQQHSPETQEPKVSTTENRPPIEDESPKESSSKRRASKRRTTRKQMESPRTSSSSSDKPTRTKKAASPPNDTSARESDSSSSKGTRKKKTKASSKVKGAGQVEDGLRGGQVEATKTTACY